MRRAASGRRRHRGLRARHCAPIGRTVGKYRIVGPLGHGGMGTVYKALDTTLGREVAIKVLHRDRADPRLVARFRTEATTLAKLNHPEIATVHELFRSRRDLLLVMELVRGETLESICGRMSALAPLTAASVADKILAALEHAHTAGVVHCDVKPANVMVTEAGGIKIMDFGTARVRGAGRTADGYTVGTPSYMSPEQLLGDEVDGRCDLYAVGVLLYRLLAGTLPFDGETALAVAQQHVVEEPPSARARRGDLPEWCDPLLRRALAKAPDDRFQSAREFRDALRSCAGITAAELREPCAIGVHICDAPPGPDGNDRARRTAPAVRRASPTVVLKDAGRAGSMFRVVVKRRRRHAGTASHRALAFGALAAAVAICAAVVATAPLRLPIAFARAAAAPVIEPVVLQVRAVDAARGRVRDMLCRLELDGDRLTISVDGANAPLHDVRYDEVVDIHYSHGIDPPAAAARSRSGVRATVGVLRAVDGGTRRDAGARAGRDWVTLRTTQPNSEFIVLRFDGEASARRAVAAIEERLPTPSRETPAPTR